MMYISATLQSTNILECETYEDVTVGQLVGTVLLSNNGRIKMPDYLAGGLLNDNNSRNASQGGKDVAIFQGAKYSSASNF